MDKPAVRDATLLIFRLVLGAIFIAHGWQILVITGVVETAGQFSASGVPQPQLSAWIAGLGQIAAGALVAIGLLTGLFAGLLALYMIAAIYFVHLTNGLFIADGGMEYALILAVSLLVLVVFGPGRASVDGVLSK